MEKLGLNSIYPQLSGDIHRSKRRSDRVFKVIHRLVDNFTHRGGISQKPLDKAVDKSTPQKEIHNAVDYLWKTVKGNLFFRRLGGSFLPKVCYTSKVCLKRGLFLNGRFNKETKKISC
ncbi:hypothetical protein QPX96_10070 [Limosilactobacillus fermentum]|nr:hypothetical protein [Limosilactobacillus fermentum]